MVYIKMMVMALICAITLGIAFMGNSKHDHMLDLENETLISEPLDPTRQISSLRQRWQDHRPASTIIRI